MPLIIKSEEEHMIIRTNNLTKVFSMGEAKVVALDHVDFYVKEREFVAIMGKSGCGKTTLINILATIDVADTGEYLLDEKLISSKSDKELAALRRSKVSVIFQNYNLISELTVKENILLPFIFNKKSPDMNYFKKIIGKLDLLERQTFYPAQLSGGEKQRAAIARALLLKPSVILADEPTGNLDSENSLKVIKLLKDCSKEFEQSVVMVTHDKDIAAYADRIVVMSDGRFIKDEVGE